MFLILISLSLSTMEIINPKSSFNLITLTFLLIFSFTSSINSSINSSSTCTNLDLQLPTSPALPLSLHRRAPPPPRTPPPTFVANPSVGPGGASFRDSAHFRVYTSNLPHADRALKILESTYTCFIHHLAYLSPGLPLQDPRQSAVWTKVNVYSVRNLGGGRAGVMHTDPGTGRTWVQVSDSQLLTPTLVHEFGHVIHAAQRTWVNKRITGAWWETFANWVSDTFLTSPLCQKSRSVLNSQESLRSHDLNLQKTIGDSFQVIVDGTPQTGNYYSAWPLFTYLTNNPDGFRGLGKDVIRQLMIQYSPQGEETPLHTLQRVCQGVKVSQIIGKYWAHMAYLDIGHPQAQSTFLAQRTRIRFDNLTPNGSGSYTVKPARRPRYMGANIIPLKPTSNPLTITIRSQGELTNHLVIFNPRSKSCQYLNFQSSLTTNLISGDEISLVIANTPTRLIQFDPFKLSSDLNKGVDYSLSLSGAKI